MSDEPEQTTEVQAPPETAPEKPADGSLHDIVAWLEARILWLESKL